MEHAAKATFWDQYGPLLQLSASLLIFACGIVIFVFQTFSTKEELRSDINSISSNYDSTTKLFKEYYDHRLDRLEIKLDRIEDKLDKIGRSTH